MNNLKSSGGVATATPFDQQITTLIERFEMEMRSGDHVMLTRGARSASWRWLLMRGKDAIGPIAVHLESDSYRSSSDLDDVWGDFLRELAIQEKIPSVPDKGTKLSDFIAWAKKQTTVV